MPLHYPTPRVQRIRGRALQERNRRIFQREPLCRPCKQAGRVTEATEVDHIVALVNGGTEHPSNLQPICHSCNEQKAIKELGRIAKCNELKGLDWIR